MELLDVKFGNIADYKKTSLYIAFPFCSGKCGNKCQNRVFWQQKDKRNNDIHLINYSEDEIVSYYNKLKTHESVVMGGLEPLDSLEDVINLCNKLLENDKPVDIIIYTGYTKEEFLKIEPKFYDVFKNLKPNATNCIIFKLGRYDLSQDVEYFNYTLGAKLATSNQFTRKYYKDNNNTVALYEEHSIFEKESL